MHRPAATAATSASPPPRGAGAGGRPLALLAAVTLLATPAAAQIIPTGSPTADILLTTALSEQRVFLTCTALDAADHETALAFWQDDVGAALALLAERNVPAQAIQAFRTAARPEALMPAPDTPFAEVQEYCAAQDGWSRRWHRRDFTELARALPEAMPEAGP